MKLQKHYAYKYKGSKRYKHVIVVPEEVVTKLGWNAGIELDQETNEDSLIIKPLNLEQKKIRNKR